MKELTIEQKAQRYDEAIERARKLKENPQSVFYEYSPNEGDTICEYIFPELKESEDNKIRKWLIEYFNKINDEIDIEDRGKIVAWLEKQSEKAKYHDVCDKCVRQSTCQSDCFLQQEEQKPVEWNEEDQKIASRIASVLEEAASEHAFMSTKRLIGDKEVIEIEGWLKSLKDRMQPKLEWSEEDENRTKKVMHILSLDGRISNTELQSIYDWLKSLKPQSQWKPSEKQLEALEHSLGDYNIKIFEDRYEILKSLYNDLKKLKE